MIFIKKIIIQRMVCVILILSFTVFISQVSTANTIIDVDYNLEYERSINWPVKWPLSANPVKFFNNLESTLGDMNSYSNQVSNAMNTWNSVRTTSGSVLVQFQQVFYAGESSGGNNRNYIIYGDTIEGGAIGTTIFDESCSSFLNTDVEIVLNRSAEWSVGAVSGCYDVETVLLHEFGHALGITHCHEKNNACIYTSGCQYFVMNPYTYTYWTKRSLHSTDIARYRSKYS